MAPTWQAAHKHDRKERHQACACVRRVQHAIWLTSAGDLLKLSINSLLAGTASAAVLSDPCVMLDTLKLAQNIQRSLSSKIAALQPDQRRSIRSAPGLQVWVTDCAEL